MALPELFQENMKMLLGDEYDSYLESFSQKRVYGLRVNTLKLSPKEFERICPFEIQRIPWIENGYYYNGDVEKPAKHPYYFAGLYYLQEPSAMTPANLLPVEPGDRVLDVCAAPGGKSTELAAKLKGTGLLVSNDISNSRAKALLKNMELFGVTNSLIMSEDPQKLVNRFYEYFDKILIDAPCSGEGMFRKEPAVIKSWLEHGNGFYANLQRQITEAALKMLKPGGMLLYSTCTFSPQENEAAVMHMMEICPELKLVPVKRYEGFAEGMPQTVRGPKELKECVRIWPQRMKGEGHFLALLKKGDADPSVSRGKETGGQKRNPQVEKQTELLEFLEDLNLPVDRSRIEMRGEKVMLRPDCGVDSQGLRIMRSGLLLGECKKARFEPSQAFAMALKKDQYKKVIDFPVSDERVIRYLKGETIQAEDMVSKKEKGWFLICVDGYPLGFAKGNGTMLKNKYLAGWRWQ